ncbi:MAG: hypothetical protein H0W89_01170 [Candidatus Levybacteria bacterium]|nr:hypothetical protein [Candidatus Levybacteria bacterium]
MPNLERQFTYAPPNQTFDLGIARHNITDLVALDQDTEYEIAGRYNTRFGHIPVGGRVEGILLDEVPHVHDEAASRLLQLGQANVTAQARYIGELSGNSNRFTLYTPKTLQAELKQGNTALIAPYLNNGNFSEYRQRNGLDIPGVSISGMHTAIVHELKNKATFHERVKAAQNPDFAVPHHEVVPVTEVTRAGIELLNFEEELYTAIGMPDYIRGVFGRLNYSDGGYGSFNIQQKNGEIRLETDDKKKRPPYTTWEDALHDAQAFMIKESADNADATIVLSRALNLKEVPGLSMHFMDGEVLPLGFNAQILDAQTKACIGTSTYEPTDPKLRNKRKEFEERITHGGKDFVHTIAREKGIDINTLRGWINFDAMFPGDEEQEVQKRIVSAMKARTLSSSLQNKLIHYGQLEKPSEYFLAESNPRRTNFIEATDEVLLVGNLPQTVASMREIIEHGILAEDNYNLPKGVKVADFAEAIGETYAQDVRGDGLVILRTRPPKPYIPDESAIVGVIMTGDSNARRQELQVVFDRLKKAA